jgi:hypothetical protein
MLPSIQPSFDQMALHDTTVDTGGEFPRPYHPAFKVTDLMAFRMHNPVWKGLGTRIDRQLLNSPPVSLLGLGHDAVGEIDDRHQGCSELGRDVVRGRIFTRRGRPNPHFLEFANSVVLWHLPVHHPAPIAHR